MKVSEAVELLTNAFDTVKVPAKILPPVLLKCTALTRQGLYNKLEGKNEFTGSELKRLSSLLSLNERDKEDIFFADYVDNSAH